MKELVCAICSKKFLRKRPDNRTPKYTCSKECLGILRSQNLTKEIVIKPCVICGKQVRKRPYRKDFDTVCGKDCNKIYSSKKLSALNRKLNPTKMTPEIRKKIRDKQLGSGEGKTYVKYYGGHLHRHVAEEKIGRPLEKGEIVHHIDGDKQNNHPDNLQVLPSQSEHARIHFTKKK